MPATDAPRVHVDAWRAMRRSGPGYGCSAGRRILALLVWRLGTGAFLDGLRVIDGGTLLAALGIGAADHGVQRLALVPGGPRPGHPAAAGRRDRRLLPGAVPQRGAARRRARATCTGRCGTAATSATSAGACGPWCWNAPPARSCWSRSGVTVLLALPSPVLTQLAARARRSADRRWCARGWSRLAVVVLALAPAAAAARRAGAGALRTGRSPTCGAGCSPGGTGRASCSPPPSCWPGTSPPSWWPPGRPGRPRRLLRLVPLMLLALLAMTLPLNVGGWGPREGVTRVGVRRGRAERRPRA